MVIAGLPELSTGHPSAQQCTRMQMQLAAARVGRLPPADRMMGRKLGSQGFTSLLADFPSNFFPLPRNGPSVTSRLSQHRLTGPGTRFLGRFTHQN